MFRWASRWARRWVRRWARSIRRGPASGLLVPVLLLFAVIAASASERGVAVAVAAAGVRRHAAAGDELEGGDRDQRHGERGGGVHRDPLPWQHSQSLAPRGLDVVLGEPLEYLVLIVVAVVAAVVECLAQVGFGLGELLLRVLEIGGGGGWAGAAAAGAAYVGLRDPDLVQRGLLRLGHLLLALGEPLRVESRPDGGRDAADGSADQGPSRAEGGEQHRRRHGRQGARERIGPVETEPGSGGVVAHHLSPCQHWPTAGKSGGERSQPLGLAGVGVGGQLDGSSGHPP